jgi:hydroxymethylbilane synthase
MKVGTRGSILAIKQTQIALAKILEKNKEFNKGENFEIISIKTHGDKIQNKTLSSFGGKGLFTKEIDIALLEGKIDFAVHSLKDVATTLPKGIVMPCFIKRQDPRDALISLKYKDIKSIPYGSSFGTSSLRRGAQLKLLRDDLKIKPIRGNIQTRLKKLDDNIVDNTILAYCGLIRNANTSVAKYVFSTSEILPAVGQGVLAITCRQEDKELIEKLKDVSDEDTQTAVLCERAFLKEIDGSCKTPIAGYAKKKGRDFEFSGQILLPDAKEYYNIHKTFKPEEAALCGKEAAKDLRKKAGESFFKKLKEYKIQEDAF